MKYSVICEIKEMNFRADIAKFKAVGDACFFVDSFPKQPGMKISVMIKGKSIPFYSRTGSMKYEPSLKNYTNKLKAA